MKMAGKKCVIKSPRDLPLGKKQNFWWNFIIIESCWNLIHETHHSRFFYRILIFKCPFFFLHITHSGNNWIQPLKEGIAYIIGLLINVIIRWLKNGRNMRRQWNQEMRKLITRLSIVNDNLPVAKCWSIDQTLSTSKTFF